MEKRRPHYRLSEIQNVVLLRGLDAFTKTAIDNADAMGLSDTQMIQAVLNMNKKVFLQEHDHPCFQQSLAGRVPPDYDQGRGLREGDAAR